MELINLERILPKEFTQRIDKYVMDYVGDDKYRIFLGQVRVGDANFTQEQTVEMIMDVTCNYFKVRRVDVISKNRNQPFTTARQIIQYLARKHTFLSASEIGKFVGDRDHATILHSGKVVKNYLQTDKVFRQKFDEIENEVKKRMIKEELNN